MMAAEAAGPATVTGDAEYMNCRAAVALDSSLSAHSKRDRSLHVSTDSHRLIRVLNETYKSEGVECTTLPLLAYFFPSACRGFVVD